MTEVLRNATYKSVDIGENALRYEVGFPNGIVPETLRRRADETEAAKAAHCHFMSYPDDALLAHLKIQPSGEVTIVLNICIADGVIASAEVVTTREEEVAALKALSLEKRETPTE